VDILFSFSPTPSTKPAQLQGLVAALHQCLGRQHRGVVAHDRQRGLGQDAFSIASDAQQEGEPLLAHIRS
jgi:hypothetical protein